MPIDNTEFNSSSDLLETSHCIAVVGQDTLLEEQVQILRSQISFHVSVYSCPPDDCVEYAAEALKRGAIAICSRGSCATAIRQNFHVPVINIPLTGFDILALILEAKQFSNKIAIVSFDAVIEGAEKIAKNFDLELGTYCMRLPGDAKEGVRRLYEQGFRVLIGGEPAVKYGKTYGMQTIQLHSDLMSVLQALREAESVAKTILQKQESHARLTIMLDSVPLALFSMDENGNVIHFNQLARNLFSEADGSGNMERGKNQFLSKTGIDTAVRTRQKWLGEVRSIRKNNYAISLNPVFTIDNRHCGGVVVIQKAAQLQKIEQNIRKKLHNRGHVAQHTFDDIICHSLSSRQLLETARSYAQYPSTVMILGESGTGKEMFAQGIHLASPRHEKPFVAINCTALPESLLESELFGYEEGAYTGAKKGGNPGLFEIAHGGTLFLDEIGEISMGVQARLLRVLEEKKIRRIGGKSLIPIDVRIICATNVDLEGAVKKKIFRADLFYRLNVLSLRLPPLRERKEDIASLANHFLGLMSKTLSKPCPILSESALRFLRSYSFPGNIRELKNIIERIIVTTKNTIISYEEIASILGSHGQSSLPSPTIKEKNTTNGKLKSEVTKFILESLEKNNGNKTATANQLGISLSTLHRKLKRMEK